MVRGYNCPGLIPVGNSHPTSPFWRCLTSADTDPTLPSGVSAMGHMGAALGSVSPEAAGTHLFVFLSLKFHILPFLKTLYEKC